MKYQANPTQIKRDYFETVAGKGTCHAADEMEETMRDEKEIADVSVDKSKKKGS